MKTRMPISTISFNSPAFLALKLEELRKAKILSLWFFIRHEAEVDEKKAHIHVYAWPAKTIQTDDLVDELIEPVPGEELPRKCLHWQNSKFADWYLYSLHDEAYLATKGQVRQHHYSRDEIICSDPDELDRLVNEIDMTALTPMGRLVSATKEGISFKEFVMRGSVPMQMFKQYEAAWQLLTGAVIERAGRIGHE